MEVYYSEFSATRKDKKVGWDMRELPGVHRTFPDSKVRNRVQKVMNQFDYHDYQVPGYFLFYDEYLKKFLCARASEGEIVDSRTNMVVDVRVPDGNADDGFETCILLLKMWECREEEEDTGNYSVNEICRTYKIETEWLEYFTRILYKRFFALESPVIQITSSLPYKDGIEEVDFAADMMRLCYRLLPSSKLSRLSLAWRVPRKKARGTRVLISDEPGENQIYDVAEKFWQRTKKKDQQMIGRIVQEALQGSGNGRFVDRVDQYYIHTADYESLCWNYRYFVLDETGSYSCAFAEFDEERNDLRKQIQNGFVKAGDLYEKMIWCLADQELTEREVELLAGCYLEYLSGKHKYTKQQLMMMWKLMAKYMEKKEDIFNLLERLKLSSEPLYYALVKEGIDENMIEPEEVLEKETMTSRSALEEWIKNEYHRDLLEQDKIKDMLMDMLASLFDQSASVSEIQKLFSLGAKIDKEKCLLLGEAYLEQGMKNACLGGHIIFYQQFLERTESLWRNVEVLHKKMEDQYIHMAHDQKTPVKVEDVRAYIAAGNYFSERGKAQLFLLEKCKVTSSQQSDMETAECLGLLVNWDTGIPEDCAELRSARQFLAYLTEKNVQKSLNDCGIDELLRYECGSERKDQVYVLWIEKLNEKMQEDIPVEKILEQLERRRIYLKQAVSTETIRQIMMKLLEQARKERNVNEMVWVLYVADLYMDQNAMTVLLRKFWNEMGFAKFREIYDSRCILWKNRRMKTPLNYEVQGNMMQVFYGLYEGIYSNGSMEQIVREIDRYLRGPYREQTEMFLKVLLRQWDADDAESFERVLDVLMVNWESEKELIAAVREYIQDEKKKKQLIRRIRFTAYQEKGNTQKKPEKRDIFSGIVLGIIAAAATTAWQCVTEGSGKWSALICMFVYAVIFFCFILYLFWFVREEKKIKVVSLLIGGIVWSLLCGIYVVSGKSFLALFASIVCIAAASAVCGIFLRKREGE